MLMQVQDDLVGVARKEFVSIAPNGSVQGCFVIFKVFIMRIFATYSRY